MNASLWDVMSTGLARISEAQVRERAEELRQRFYALMSDGEFLDAITYGPNTPKKVRYRFEVMRRTISEVFDA